MQLGFCGLFTITRRVRGVRLARMRSQSNANAGGSSSTYASGSTIPAGGCTISVNITAANSGTYINSILAGALQTNLGNNQSQANATLTVNTLGFITGKVFDDDNVTPNGVFAAGTDTPITGVSIELHSGASCSAGL